MFCDYSDDRTFIVMSQVVHAQTQTCTDARASKSMAQKGEVLSLAHAFNANAQVSV